VYAATVNVRFDPSNPEHLKRRNVQRPPGAHAAFVAECARRLEATGPLPDEEAPQTCEKLFKNAFDKNFARPKTIFVGRVRSATQSLLRLALQTGKTVAVSELLATLSGDWPQARLV
jgi:hypothetical protein